MFQLLIIGSNFKSLNSYLQQRNLSYVVLKDISKTKDPTKKLKGQVLCDFASEEGIDKALQELDHRFGKISGVLCVYERYVLAASTIARKLAVPALPLNAAEACTDKFIMRQRFAECDEQISPDFAIVHSEEDIRNFTKSHSFPLILKPANLVKSLLVTKNHSFEELLANYHKMIELIDSVYAKYSPDREPKIIVEEFLEGPIHSVDAFIDSKGEPHVLKEVVDYETGYDIGYNDNFHYSRLLPSRLSPGEVEAVRHTASLGCKALDMRNTPAHIEIIRTAKGPRIVEIGARNGGYRERMHYLANGIDITGNAIAIALGNTPNIAASKHEHCAVLELFPKSPGIFLGIANVEQLQSLSSLEYFAIKQTIGQFVGKSSDGYKMCAIIILHNDDEQQFSKDVAFIRESVFVLTDSAGQ